MRSGKNKICEEILWQVGMGLGLENVQVQLQADSHVSDAHGCANVCVDVMRLAWV